ncbi:hypothetical protein VFPPC_17522 [Pochonia chlamydosporia 170]|uniref:Uncharacterized protein n=1 Tax=Pochonia chlamydosporia 170 TaxID=1380566 RepID=A0A219AT02_METCM|nr:hypothetical protein VFPPC_17522 [Pochonia chlamydosporia 170]OWT43315.1 hypothetical protein VFPPC_17522 [Pochonia chlamydosporia 170]
MTPKQESTYYLVPNHLGLDPSAREADFNSHSWVQPIVIEDEDLMFGGKSLSAWYEEDRRRLSSGSDDGRTEHSQEEERRGRERVRRHHKSSKSHRKCCNTHLLACASDQHHRQLNYSASKTGALIQLHHRNTAQRR